MTDSLKALLTDKMIKMEQYLAELKEAKPDDYKEFLSSHVRRYAIERLLQLIVDLALDINNIIIKDTGKPPASDYFNSFIELIEIDVLDKKFAYQIAPSTGLRNRLVHEYEKIDNRIVYKSIDKTYDYYIEYIKAIVLYMESI
ncbi:type VII toxin-antitoxin system HepT family RNase toxin [Natronospora cellulosivora (SeqCode)]